MPVQINFSDIFEELKSSITTLAKNSIKDYAVGAEADGKKFLESIKDKLQRWTNSLIEGKLTKDDFEYLIGSQKDLSQMEFLKQAGLTAIRIDQFKTSLLNLVIDTIFNAIKI
jgi:hypothetical protein